MNLFYPEHIKVLHALLRYQVRFLLIGGYAVIVYGYTRTTGDLDLWIDPSEQNKAALIDAFRYLQFDASELEIIHQMNFKEALVFSMGTVPQKTDFLTKVSHVDFSDAYTKVVMMAFDDLQLPFVHYNDLVLMKMTTGRLKDQADIEELQKIHQHKKE
ncbi:MAG: hypothetical protein IPG18_07755 [Saprospiraceae bacterium]|nr:hypothetical protein [Saprospiraceae bacterium]